MANITGTNGNDTLYGTTGDDVFRPGLGTDLVNALDYNVNTFGGFDTLYVDYSRRFSGNSSEIISSGTAWHGTLVGAYPTDRIDFAEISALHIIGSAGSDSYAISSTQTTLPAGGTLDIDGGEGEDALGIYATQLTQALQLSFDGLTHVLTTNFGTFQNFENVSVQSGSGNDSILFSNISIAISVVTGAGNDTVITGAGNDYIDGGSGVDSLSGGPGDDYFALQGIDAGDVIDGGSGTDTISFFAPPGEALNLDLSAFNGAAEISYQGATFRSIEAVYVNSTIYADRLVFGPDVLAGVLFRAGDGDDYFLGTSGGDGALGEAGNDTLLGGAGDDVLTGGDGADLISGGVGNDHVDGGPGDDVITGEAGDDGINAGDGADSVDGGAGNDSIYGGPGADTINGGDGNDYIVTWNDLLSGDDGAADVVNAGAGDDSVIAAWGDVVDGGSGVNTLSLNLLNAPTGVTVDLSGAVPVFVGVTVSNFQILAAIYGSSHDDLIKLGPNAPALSYLGIQAWDGNDTVEGSPGDDQIFGGNGDDSLVGLGGNDYLVGSQGKDFLSGGDGADSLLGGSEDDVLLGGAGLDTLQGEDGNDSLDGGNGNDVLNGGAGNDTLLGGLGDDSLIAGGGVDSLVGGDGNDTLDGLSTFGGFFGPPVSLAGVFAGGLGNDSYFVTNGVTVIENAGEGIDTVYSASSYVLGDNLEVLFLSDIDGISGTGNALDNLIVGGSGSNVLNGAGGNDRIDGGAGDDTLNGGNGNDTLIGGIGANVLNGDDGNDSLTGGGQADTLNGGAGQDFIAGYGGDDRIDGGAGNDVAAFTMPRSQATITLDAANHVVRVQSGEGGLDIISHLEQFAFPDALLSFVFKAPGSPLVANFNPAFGWLSQDVYPRHVADVNGDGRADIVGFGTAGVWVSYGSAAGTFSDASLAVANFGQNAGWATDNGFHRELADVNGDGRADILGFGYAGTLVSLARADGTYDNPTTGIADFGVNQGWANQNGFARTVGDVNGDGKADIVGFGYAGTLVALGRGDGTFQPVKTALADFGVNQGWANDDQFHRTLADVNGDGRADLVGFGYAGTLVALANADGTFQPVRLATAMFGVGQGWTSNDARPRAVADLNHDGFADILSFDPGGTMVAFGNGDGTFTPPSADLADFGKSQGWSSDTVWHRELADLNGDGYVDVVAFGIAGVLAGLNQEVFFA